MRLSRRQSLHLAAGAAALPVASRVSRAQTYPARPLRIIVPFAAGNPSDIVGRLLAQRLSEQLQQQVVIDNRPGAGSNIGTEQAVRAAPNGYTLLFAGTAHAINATLYGNLKFNFIRDIAPVAGLARLPNVMVVNLSVPAKTVPEFIAYAKANPDKINMATAGVGVSGHLAGELFKTMTGVKLVHIPYRGTTLADLISGRVQVTFEPLPTQIEYIRAGKLRPLAVTTATRSEALPEIPTISEFVPGYEASTWYGIGAPKNTSPEIIRKLNYEINAALASPAMKARIADFGGVPLVLSPAEFGKFIAEETEKWGKVIRAAGIKPE
jgi:tripartite-type tricarboxylate transporter receptor subunit TctC